jgi:predicted transcriptional regulator
MDDLSGDGTLAAMFDQQVLSQAVRVLLSNDDRRALESLAVKEERTLSAEARRAIRAHLSSQDDPSHAERWRP